MAVSHASTTASVIERHVRTSLSPQGLPHRAGAMQGISLFVVLVALVMLSLAAVGLIRMVDTGSLVAGNLSFKQATTLAADRATERVIAWLDANQTGGKLLNDDPTNGYYASTMLPLDLDDSSTNVARNVPDWSGKGCSGNKGGYAQCLKSVDAGALPTPTGGTVADTALSGISTRVLITRMCKVSGDPDAAGNSCVRPIAVNLSKAGYMGASLGTGGYTLASGASTEYGPYFRIVVRAEGPRQTVSFTESTVHFPKGAVP